ncbi:EpsG family protein [Bariatricus sp. SGI.019]|uniref:EpsG family protein n=1 Tax=Bariatricus sp. SGI.019 TaxID=3420548 RepID=UPI003CFDED5A
MSNYYLILVWVAVAWMIGLCTKVQRTEYVCGEKVQRYYPLWAFLIYLPLVIWSGFRGYVGDTGAYMKMFQEIPSGLRNIPSYMNTVEKDKGFYFLSAVIKNLISDNVNVYFIILALIQVALLIKVYRKYSSNYIVTFFLFVASTDYISWMFNGIRQFTAVTITFFAFEYILKKKYVPAVLTVLFAALFHGSALLVLPFIFIAQGQAWNKKTILFIIAVIVAVMFIGKFTDILDTLLAETQYKNVVSDWQDFQDDGTNIIRVLVYAIPSILSLVGLRFIKYADDPVINLCTNMSIASVGFYVVSMFTSGIFIGRLPIYFSLYSYILLPWEIEHMFSEKSIKLVYLAMIAGYLGFYMYSIMGLA